jgi:hypothetical protein
VKPDVLVVTTEGSRRVLDRDQGKSLQETIKRIEGLRK